MWSRLGVLSLLGTVLALAGLGLAQAQDSMVLPPLEVQAPETAPLPASLPLPDSRLYPINLPTALQLANVQPLDIALASERIRLAAAQLERARVLWLPSLLVGTDYLRHDGQIQDVAGKMLPTNKSAVLVGAGPVLAFSVSDALLAPLAARRVVGAREASLQTAQNDSLLMVAEAYFFIQQARGEMAGAMDVVRHAKELAQKTEHLAPGLVPPVEAVRAKTELARRRQVVEITRERWQVASAELVRILRLDPSILVQPQEPPDLQVTLIAPERTVDELIPLALTNRPELASQQNLVQATLQRLRQERIRPLVPSVLLRGTSTLPPNGLAGGYFGGGRQSYIGEFGVRGDFDVQVLWELQNLGFGNQARMREQRAEHQLAIIEGFRIQDRVAADVVQAHAQVKAAAARMKEAAAGLEFARDSVSKNFEGLSQTRRLGGNVILLVIRPQEVVASIQALAQAYTDFFASIADYDRAQFRLYRALGQPAQALSTPGLFGPSP